MSAGERIGMPRRAFAVLHLDGGDDARLERPLVLLEIERDLFVVQLGQERPHDEPRDHAENRRDRDDADGEHDGVGVVERVHHDAAERHERPSRGHG